MSYQTESSRWRAVQSRDELAASAFIYAVITTKIYCRPSCPSRLARRANVCFYDNVDAATSAGYRPCRRCKPDQLLASHLDNKAARREAVERVCRFMEQADSTVKFADAAKHVNLSPRYLHGLFKDIMGMTPAKYAQVYKSTQALGCFSDISLAQGTYDVEPLHQPVLFDTNWLDLDSTINTDWQTTNLPTVPETAHRCLHLEDCHLEFPPSEYSGQSSAVSPNDFDLYLDEFMATTGLPRGERGES